ncbi:MAG: multidrug resistance transporter, Bcr family [Candidatus Midichloriaceae bacterium]|jgi:DHA1 family bicyclomycin/chloramphenicol resistance-like MFS transporter/DHA1 family 2-module integral membrane pump EmrD-like MFS transporter|nr:multidrug resistance transporter, Bcr family [Candidatus Midichloriaceae bacterium]
MDSKNLFFATIALTACLTQLAADICAPSIPDIALSLKTDIHLVEYTMALYMFGVALSQLIYGPLSEGIGRKVPIAIGIVIAFFGTLICLCANTIETLNVGRLVQGCGTGACACLWRVIFRDKFDKEKLAKYGSYLGVFITFIIPASPLLGSVLQYFFNWRASFIFVSFYSIIVFLSFILCFKETSQHHHNERLAPSYIISTFLKLITNRVFIGASLCTFLSYGAFFTWFIIGPALLINEVGITPIGFGLISCLGGGLAMGSAGWLNGKLVVKYGMRAMLALGWGLMSLSGILMLSGYIVFGINAWVIACPTILFYFGSTFIWPSTFATAFTPFGKIAGYAGALYGFLQISGAAVLGGIAAYLPNNSPMPLALLMLCTPILSFAIYELIVLSRKQ